MSYTSFHYIEQYIEYIAGLIDIRGNSYGYFAPTTYAISLARHDKRIIESLSHQSHILNLAYTDKQAALAVKLIQKYRRQLEQQDINLPETFDSFRLGIRRIDRTKRAWIENDKLILKFPFETQLIDHLRKESKISQGSMNFDYDSKTWIMSLTEYTVNFVKTLSELTDFQIDKEIELLFTKILEVENTAYTIELLDKDGSLQITNSDESLIDYIEKNIGGLSHNNILSLIDYSSVLGYKVSADLIEKYLSTSTDIEKSFILNRKISVVKNDDTLGQILDYASKFDRSPVYYYTKDFALGMHGLNKLHSKSDVSICPKLLVTDTEFMIGPKKQNWLTNAQKIVVLK